MINQMYVQFMLPKKDNFVENNKYPIAIVHGCCLDKIMADNS